METFLTTEEQDLRQMAVSLAKTHFQEGMREWEREDVDRKALYARVRRILGEAGLLGIRIPERYGGGGGDLMQTVVAIEGLAMVNPFVGNIVSASSGNQTQALLHFGSDAVKERFLPLMAEGRAGGAIAITEPQGGSDVGAMQTRVRTRSGVMRLTGEKAYITDADVADYAIVAARMSDEPGTKGVGLVLVETAWDGVVIERVDKNMMGSREIVLRFDDVEVPEENVLLGAGEFKRFLLLHNAQRCHTGAVSLGVAQGAYEDSLAYAKERQVFGAPVASHQGIRWMLVDMLAKLEACRLILYRAARAYDIDRPETPAECFLAKLMTNEGAVDVVGEALQVFGCFGISLDGPAELRYRFAKGLCVAGGTPQILRNGLAHQVIDVGVR